jgi:hypothetical protein
MEDTMAQATLIQPQTDASPSTSPSVLDLEWRPIPGWPHYEVSEWGDVRRVAAWRKRRPGAVLAPFFRDNGYAQVHLYAEGRRRRFLVHRLVALAFLGRQPSPHHEVAHLNGNRANNHYSNLRWVRHRENEAHKQLHGTLLRGAQIGTARLDERRVREIKRALDGGESQSAVARRFGVSASTVHLIARGRSWRHVR